MIAIIGVPGSGKTHTIKLLEKQGYKVLIADEFFTSQYKKNNEGYNLIRKYLGDQYVNSVEVIKNKLRKYAINNMAELEKIIHPLLEKHLKSHKYDFVEIPIISSYYSNFYQYFSIIVNIINSQQNINSEIIKRGMNKQLHSIIIDKTQGKKKLKIINVHSGDIKKIVEIIK